MTCLSCIALVTKKINFFSYLYYFTATIFFILIIRAFKTLSWLIFVYTQSPRSVYPVINKSIFWTFSYIFWVRKLSTISIRTLPKYPTYLLYIFSIFLIHFFLLVFFTKLDTSFFLTYLIVVALALVCVFRAANISSCLWAARVSVWLV